MDALVLLRRENKILTVEITGTKSGTRAEEKDFQITSFDDLFHMEPPNPVTIAGAKKCLLAGA